MCDYKDRKKGDVIVKNRGLQSKYFFLAIQSLSQNVAGDSGIENRFESTFRDGAGGPSPSKVPPVCGCKTCIQMNCHSFWGIKRHSMSPLPSLLEESAIKFETVRRKRRGTRSKTGEESTWIGPQNRDPPFRESLPLSGFSSLQRHTTAEVWLCCRLVRLTDWFTSVHHCRLTCAFTGRYCRLGHCLTNIMQWWLSVHGNF